MVENDNVVTLIEAYSVIFVYIAYITVIIIEQILMHYTKKKMRKELEITLADDNMDSEKKRESVFVIRKSVLEMEQDLKVSYSVVDDQHFEKNEVEEGSLLWEEFEGDHQSQVGAIENNLSIQEEETEVTNEFEEDNLTEEEDISLWQQFKSSIIRFDCHSFKQSNIIIKIFIILMLPSDTFFYFILPVVNLDQRLNGWSRLLNSIHIISLPAFMVYFIGG